MRKVDLADDLACLIRIGGTDDSVRPASRGPGGPLIPARPGRGSESSARALRYARGRRP